MQRFNAIGEPLLYRIGLAGLVSRFGADRVQIALVQDAARLGVVSIASAGCPSLWPRRPGRRDVLIIISNLALGRPGSLVVRDRNLYPVPERSLYQLH